MRNENDQEIIRKGRERDAPNQSIDSNPLITETSEHHRILRFFR